MAVCDEFQGLAEQFSAGFGNRRPAWLVRAPGRINLIGEHTDYNGFPVMPMAINRAIRMAVAPRDDGLVELKNADGSLYGDRRFALSDPIAPYAAADWGNYVKAGVQSLVELALSQGRAVGELKGMSCLVAGDIPPAAGLSSSTALVVASALAFSAVNDMEPDRRAMAERMAEAEHYVGTQGGGMDQAVCLLAREGEVLKIDFFPLRVTRVAFPRDYRIVAAHSTVRAQKTGESLLAYNRRVLECRMAVCLLARELGVEPPERLADLASARPDVAPEGMVGLLKRVLGRREGLSLGRASALFGIQPGQFAQRFLRMANGRLLPMPGDGLKVVQRCRHVLSEAARTERAAECLACGDLEEFGRLMDESHRSCADDYEISCYELDQLVALMRGAGALGARLTGAGFGGFAIALAHRDRVEAITHALDTGFYKSRRVPRTENVFVFQPAPGALRQRVG